MDDVGLRADARENRDRLLTIAAEAFARDGGNASLRDIARVAGVGIGTLYRRFPTRAALAEAIYRDETRALAGRADALLEDLSPREALVAWSDAFIDLLIAKRGMADVLTELITQKGELQTSTRAILAGALEVLLAAGRSDGSFQTDLTGYELLLGLGGVTTVALGEDRTDLARRIARTLVAGLSMGIGPASGRQEA